MKSSKFFADCKTIEELKKAYRKLAILHHPDNSGDAEIMKAVNSEYDRLFNVLKDIHNGKAENSKQQNTEKPEEFREIINTLIHLDGLIIEVCGSWLWVSGDTFKHHGIIKELGFKWASNKKMWYLGEISGTRRYTMSMKNIRNKYGSEVFHSEPLAALA